MGCCINTSTALFGLFVLLCSLGFNHNESLKKKKAGVDAIYVIKMGHFTLTLDGC